MIIIDKKYFMDCPEMDWLKDKLSDDFELKINDGISKVVFGYNGIGKSSLVRLLSLRNEPLRFLSYEKVDFGIENNINFDSNRIVISVNNKQINALENKKNEIRQLLNFSYYVDSKFTKNRINKLKNRVFKDISESLFNKDTVIKVINDYNEYSKFIGKYNKVDPHIFCELIVKISNVHDVEKELQTFRNNKYFELFMKANDLVDENDTYCPICGKEEVRIKEIIQNKLKELNNVAAEFAKELSDKGVVASKEVCGQYVSLYNELVENPTLFNDFAIIGKNIERIQEIIANTEKYKTIKEEIYKLESIKKQMFLEVLNYRDSFIADICKYLKVKEESIEFNNEKCEVTINLPRAISTYSTGEQHILIFIYELYSFIGSENETLIMDDPVSSLDMMNMYKIGFEIVDKVALQNKNMIIFTHSTDLMNIISSHNEDRINFYYLEKANGKIFCDLISSDIYDPNVFTINKLLGINKPFFNSLKIKDENPKCQEAKVWHYDLEIHNSLEDTTLSNYSLIDYIENYSLITKENFYSDSFVKIKTIAALRVWLEKKLFELIPETNIQRRNKYLNSNQIGEKIKVIKKYAYEENLFEQNSLNINSILSKKVMLNQNCHYYSQVLPFSYAINLSIDDVNAEVNEIKAFFKK